MRKTLLCYKYIFFFLFLQFTLTVKAQLSPVINVAMEDQTIVEGSAFTSINLDELVEDPDTPDEELMWSTSGSMDLSVAITDHVAFIELPDINWNGSELITFTVTDNNTTDSDDALFTVIGENDPPIITDILGEAIHEGENFSPIDLALYVSDVDNDVADLSWTASVNDNLNTDITGSIALVSVNDPEWLGTESILFTVSDPSGSTDTDDALFTVNSVNELPVTVTESYPIDEGGNLSTPAPGVLSNDTDADGDVLSAVLVSSPAHAASFDLNSDGSFSYVHDGTETATDAFQYAAFDGTAAGNDVEVSINVNNTNDAPVITTIAGQTIAEGTEFAPFDLDDFVSDEEDADDLLAWEFTEDTDLVVDINNGTHVATIAAPGMNWNGSGSVTFIVKDSDLATDTETATFTVLAENDPPIISEIPGEAINEGASFAPINLNLYVTDIDNDLADLTWTASVNDNLNTDITGSIASVSVNDPAWSGTESILFTVSDPSGGTDTDDALFTVNSVNELPVTVAESFPVDEGGNLSVPAPGVLSNDDDADGDVLSAVLVSSPAHAASFGLNGDGSFSYVHDGTETATDAFRYAAHDGTAAGNEVEVTINVTNTNDTPVITTIEDQTIAEGADFTPFDLDDFVSDEEDADGSLAWEFTGNTELDIEINNGTHIATIAAPNKKWNGSEMVTFTVSDSDLATDSETATFTVTALAEAPVALPDVYGVNEGSTLTVGAPGVLDNDSDGDLDPITAIQVTGPSHASSFTLNADGSFTYIHDGTETTPDAFTYRAWDGGSFSNTVTVTINIAPQNDPPVVSDIPDQTITEGGEFETINLDSYVNDADHADNQMTWTYSGNSSLTVTISASRVATITAPNADWNGSETISFTASDPEGANNMNAAVFTVTTQNDPPVVGDIPNQTISEGASFATINLDAYVTDQDNPDNEITWSYNGNSQLEVTINASRVATIVIPDVNWYGTETITFEASDPANAKDNDPAIFTVTNVNDNPVLSGIEGSPVSYTEADGAVPVTSSIVVSDLDNLLTGATVSISSNYQNGEDVLAFTNAFGITGNFNSSTGQLSLAGSASPAAYQSALRTITYENTSLSPVTATRVITFMVHDGSANSNALNRNITINSSNSAPVLNDPSSSSVSFTEGTGAVVVTSTIGISDADNLNLQSALIKITSGFQTPEDVLTYTSFGGISGVYNSTTGELALTGTTTLSNYRSVLRSVRYNNISEAPSSANRTIQYSVNDGFSPSNIINKTVTITPVNDQPVLAAIEDVLLTYSEGEPAKAITASLTVNDVDNPNLTSALINISSNYHPDQDILSFTNANGISGNWNPATGQLMLTGGASVANYQAALRSVTYSNTSNNPNTLTRSVRFVVSDGSENSNPQIRNISINITNDPPVLNETVFTPVLFNENGPAVRLTNTITVTDADNITLTGALATITSGFKSPEDTLTFASAGGITGNYSDATGILTLTGATSLANYQTVLRSIHYNNTSEDPTAGNRTITLTVNDGGTLGISNIISKTVTVSSLNDPPEAKSVIISGLNNRIGTTHTGSFTFFDPDGDNPGIHTYQWYRANNPLGTSATPITGATTVTYKPVKADGGMYISFEVTPVDEFNMAGTPVKSTFKLINAAPEASNVRIFAPVTSPGSQISGRFTYYDKENDPRGNATFIWYRSNVANPTPASPGTRIDIPATDSTYQLRNSEAGKWVWFRVNPVATSGSTPGDSVWSNIIGPIGKYTANISGDDTVCQGAIIPITLTITGGKAPYEAKLHRAGVLAKDTVITLIQLSPRIINVKIPGTYTLISVTDEGGDLADLTDVKPVLLVISPRPKALISGSTAICKESGSHAPLSLNFTAGEKPWTVTIRRSENLPYNDTIIHNINANPYSFSARVIGNGPTRHRIISIQDKNGCPGDTASGSAWLRYRLAPTAVISGSDSICPAEPVIIKVELTSGSTPWSFTYLKDGANPSTVAGIPNKVYNLTVTQPGIYSLSSVTDISGTGCGTGQANIIGHVPPVAVISGSATICEHTSTNLNVTLTGKSPWKFGYTRNFTLDSTVVENVTVSPRSVPVRNGGTYRLYEVIDRNGCKGTFSGNAVINITPAPDVSISGLKPAYNFATNDIDTIIGSPAGGEYSGPGVIGNFFIPKIAGLGAHNITYKYHVAPSGCYGYDTALVNVMESNAIITFENNRTRYCTNDAPFTVTGVNLEGSYGTFSISGGNGLTDHGDNTATVDPSQLNFNKYTITYSYIMDGELFPEPAYFDVGAPPVADFSWASECYHAGQSIEFTNKSTSTFGYLTDTSYYWKVTTNSGFDDDSSQNLTYTFAQPGVYDIQLQISNTNGCSDVLEQQLNLRPNYSVKEAYYENFESKPIEWQSGKSQYNVNSWQLGNPSKHGDPLRGFSGAHLDTVCWYTKIPSSPAPTEQSWVTSPCFDFSRTNNPMLTMWVWRLFNANRDGANIQVTADSGRTWVPVGEIGDGENWFNSYTIRGNPGGTALGWSNDNGSSNDAGWIRTRHSLDHLKGKQDIQFRIAYGSDQLAQNNDGIAFDDFSITERTKMVFIEHFTNNTVATAAKADSTLDAYLDSYGSNAIDIQYHTSNPDGDPFYDDSPMVPTSRQFYYGLSTVPYSVIDGGTEYDHFIDYLKNSRPLNKNKIIVKSLEDSKFHIAVEAERSGNFLIAQVGITANQELPVMELSIRIAVLESIVDGIKGENGDTVYRNVVRAMLPDAAGTTMYQSWNNDVSVEQTWVIEDVADINNLLVAAFIQDEVTHEIFNADLDTVVIAVGTDDPVIGPEKINNFTVFPNPAQHIARIKINGEVSEIITLQMFNNLGRMVYSSQIPVGTDIIEIPLEEYPDGLYMLRLADRKKLMGITKLIISK